MFTIPAFELPATSALVGILVGAVAGVALFVGIVALVAYHSARTRRLRVPESAGAVVFVPRYAPSPLVPSSALSARAFAKMGYAFGERVGPVVDPFELMAEERSAADETREASPVVVDRPSPLAIIPSSSSAMIKCELDYEDDGATQIGEPFFDEPPRPRTMGERPKIRPIAQAAPRWSGAPGGTARALAVPPEPPTLRRVTDAP